MNVVMVHPVHGAKVAINEIEIAQDEKNGWTRYNADTPKQAAQSEKPKRKTTRKAEPPVEQPNEVNALGSASEESEGS